jgi:hypothetical protein
MGAYRSDSTHVPSKRITIPCALVASIGNENLYLLDENKNLVFYNKPNMMSLDLEHLIDSFKKRIKPERYDNTYDIGTSIIDNCELKQVTFLNLGQIPDVFLPSEIIINGDILNQYNLSDIDLTIFENTKLFKNYIKPNDLQTYKNLNDKDKKRLVFLLYINYIEEALLTRLVTTNNIKFNFTPTFTEDDNLRHTYLNPSIIENSINVLTEFKNVFIIKIPKKEAVKKIIPQTVIPPTVIPPTVVPPTVEPKQEEPKQEEPKQEDKTGIIVGSVIGGLALIIIIVIGVWWKFFRKPAINKIDIGSETSSIVSTPTGAQVLPAKTGIKAKAATIYKQIFKNK